ncbi:SLATT domain-containing protein [Undibacterium sp. Tian12W]|uniref:SLATT domain-containing protein n=1 Tax=Undibacterium sp. Tian12W TaxID=3413054 RepID=UPI003BF3EA95
MDQRSEEIVKECKRQEESCLYTSTALFEWLKEVRHWRTAFIVLPIVAGSIAGAKILMKDPGWEWVTAIAALLAGLFPAIFKALDLDVSMKSISDSASRFKILQDRFRLTSSLGPTKPIQEMEDEFMALMDRMDDARSASPAIPDRHFKKAQKKITKGDYSFEADAKEKQ